MPEREHGNSNKKARFELSPKEAVEGARLAATNARALLEFAVTGSTCHKFGPSIAMCVLASEEGAKALALFFCAVSPENIVPLRDVFSRHKTKHDLSSWASFMIHLTGLMVRVKEEIQSDMDRGIDTEQRPGSRWVARVVEELRRLTHSSNDETTRFVTWYRAADRLKQEGFYVDRRGKLWHHPGLFTADEFAEYRSYVEWWLDVVDSVLAVPVDEFRAKLKELNLQGPGGSDPSQLGC